MDSSSPEFSSGNKSSPRRELQGPRPTPLKVRKDSHKIKKPPLGPQQPQLIQSYHHQQPQIQHRPPVIIYTVSPKVIHTEVSEFMSTVQRLTGFSSSSSTTASSSSHVCVSPAARFATIDKANNSNSFSSERNRTTAAVMDEMEMEIGPVAVERTAGGGGVSFPGILSPVPSALPPISPNFFSSPPPPDLNSLGFLHDLSFSPIFQGNRNYIEGTMVPSPTTLFNTPLISPTLSFDFFNHFLDLYY